MKVLFFPSLGHPPVDLLTWWLEFDGEDVYRAKYIVVEGPEEKLFVVGPQLDDSANDYAHADLLSAVRREDLRPQGGGQVGIVID